MIVFIITFYRWHTSGFQVQDKTNASLFSVTTETTRDVKLIHRKGRINIHLRTGYSYLEIHHFSSALLIFTETNCMVILYLGLGLQ